MKSNLEYYNHRKDSHRHPKFKLLRALHGGGERGWAAEGRFWALNNIISDSENCELDLTKNRNKAVVAEELNISLDELNSFIQTLLSDDIELLIEVDPGIYTTKKVKEAFGKVSDEREKARIRKDKGKKTNSSDEILKSSGEPNKRVKESKVNESRREENNLIPSLPDVVSFFLKQKQTDTEAKKFYHWYQSKGWEGIEDWKSRALKWILGEKKSSASGNNGNHTSGLHYFIGKEFEEMITKIEGEKCSKETRSKYYEEYDVYFIEGIEKGCWVKKDDAKLQGLILFKDRKKIP
jgi:hypothetical protein